MIEIIGLENAEKWDAVVRSFDSYDVYYLSGYVKAFRLHGDGEPILLYFSNGSSRAVCVMMKRDIALDSLYDGSLEKERYYDLITPYGYGGFMFNAADVTDEAVACLNNELWDYLKHEGYISAFFRFHPVLRNATYHTDTVDVVPLGKTIAMDLSSPDTIWENIISKNRNMIRKAERNGVEIRHGKGHDLLKIFKEIYNETMRHDNAEEYYYFDDRFYESIDRDLADNYEIFYAVYNNEIVAMSIVIFAGRWMHYHLSGSRYEYRNLAPSNLLLYEAALWGHGQGFVTFHLGGGVGSGEDSLYKFKAAFNRNSDYRFSIGKMLIDKDRYNELVAMRKFSESELSQLKFFPKYRAVLQ